MENQNSYFCSECSKPINEQEASLFDPPICIDCAKQMANETKKQMIISISVSIILMVIGIIVIQNPLGFMLAGIPYGWMLLTKITPNMFIWMHFVGWIIYFFLKLILSYFVGIVALPIKLYQWISSLVKTNKLLKSINN